MTFHIFGIIIPIDELIFFKMVIAPPTIYIYIIHMDQVLLTNNHYKPLLITIKTMVIAPPTRIGHDHLPISAATTIGPSRGLERRANDLRGRLQEEMFFKKSVSRRRGKRSMLAMDHTHDGSMVLVYMLTLGVYWWDPCYHIWHTWILWDMECTKWAPQTKSLSWLHILLQ